MRFGIPLLAGGLALLPLANGLASLASVFVAFGLASGMLDVAMNTEAVAVERRFGRHQMSGMHGTWSVSVLAGAAVASVAVAAGIPIGVELPLVGAFLVVASFPLLRWLPAPHEPGIDGTVAAASDEHPVGRVVLLCLIGSAAFLSEGIATEWSALFLREAAGTGPGTAGLGVVAFAAGMTLSRFAGDGLAARFDPSWLARVGASLGAAALTVSIVAPGAIVSIVAFATLGLGLGPVVPLAFRAASALGIGPDRTALGVVVTAGYVGSIVGPLAVGFTADLAGLRAAFTIPVIACLVVAIAAGAIRNPGNPTDPSAR